ncbi:TlpA family protein disulfide reductase [Flagellimonas algicola]|uniref:TlpA family protein disulfide reductase n=1 Tax=Flagellimonas algicola TaxID=2583815 RepID=A0ABY2WGV9_9FLAO|nr:TlpA disulfide reductase family protein [Allomuricauda algicola]TMU50616.1 TlpA family protein disulfide reductase [Allomuricauda algicola]
MKLSKEQISDGIWILAIVLILFTPVGFHLGVITGKLFSGSAGVIAEDKRETLENYQWKLVHLDGSQFNFEDTQGKVVLVNFWATWCPPCVAELPSMDRLHNAYKDKVIFAFVANDDKEKVQSFLVKREFDLPVYFEASRTPDLLVSRSIPATYILDKSGAIVVREIGAAQWDSEETRELLDQLLAE